MLASRLSELGPAMALFLLSCAASMAQGSPDPPGEGSVDWAGWIYLDEGGDLPVRARLSEEEALVDLPHLQRFGIPATWTRTDAGGFVLESTIGETRLRFEATEAQGSTFQGRVTVGASTEGDFWLHRSALPLDRGDPTGRVACTGTYRFPSGRTVIVTSRRWNELRYLDLATGNQGTLFATSDSTFFAGRAEYVPTDVSVEALCADPGDGSRRLRWSAGDRGIETGVPTRLEERELTFTNEGVSFEGTVLLPGSPRPVPGVVLLGGSNWTTRGTVRGDAELLAAAGVAVLIYDKRGYGASGGETIVPFALTASDARAAARALRDLPPVLDHAVGVAGRSRGGWFAPLAAAEPGALDFVLLFVPSGRSPADQETFRRLAVLEDQGASPAELRDARTYLELMYAWIETGRGWEAYRAALDALSQAWFAILGGADAPDPDVWRWDLLNAHFDPFPYWERVTVPVLGVFGEEDRTVDTQAGVARIRAALARGSNPDVAMVVVPGVDHSLRRGSGLPLHMRTGYGPEVWPTVHEWLRRF